MAVAVVGSGLAGFTAYQTLRRGGLEPGEIAVFGTQDDPAGAFRRRAEAIRQREMRSESDGHCLPTTFPGLAVRSAIHRRSPLPLLASVLDRYHPTLDEFLSHVASVRERSGWDESLHARRIERVRAVDGAVTVVGAGLAAATEWRNALDAGAEVVSVRRRDPVRRALNVPREYYSRRGLGAFHRLGTDERSARLRALLTPSYPPGAAWDEPLARAAVEGRFRVEPSLNGSEQVICATGFLRAFHHDSLLARLVDDHGLETVDGWIVVGADGSVPALADATRTLALAGGPAQWAFPAADTLAGARYVARGFLRRIKACPTH